VHYDTDYCGVIIKCSFFYLSFNHTCIVVHRWAGSVRFTLLMHDRASSLATIIVADT
jgi:hypothetical protein